MNTTDARNGINLSDVHFTNHFIKQAKHKGFTAEQIVGALSRSGKYARVTPVTKYPGQMRFCGNGVAVVMDGNTAITIYADRVVTPLREAQMNDPDALNSSRLNKG